MCPFDTIMELLTASDNSFNVEIEPNDNGVTPSTIIRGSGGSDTINGRDSITITANDFSGPFIVLDVRFEVKGTGSGTIFYLREGQVRGTPQSVSFFGDFFVVFCEKFGKLQHLCFSWRTMTEIIPGGARCKIIIAIIMIMKVCKLVPISTVWNNYLYSLVLKLMKCFIIDYLLTKSTSFICRG